MENQINLTTATDLELAQYLNGYHIKSREAEQGLQLINAEIARRNQAAAELKAAELKAAEGE